MESQSDGQLLASASKTFNTSLRHPNGTREDGHCKRKFARQTKFRAAWSSLWRVAGFTARGRVLRRVVEFVAGGRVQGRWSSSGRAGHFGCNNVEQQSLLLILAEF
jgi:hypothetical protein